MKLCSHCKLKQPKYEFTKDKYTKDGLHSWCKNCQREYRKSEHYKKIQEKYNKSDKCKETVRRYGLKRDYNVTLEDYDSILKSQNGKCAICGIKNNNGRAFSIDHCHKTGKIRGLLCLGCNTSLGNLKDDIKLLEKAIKYLKNE